MRFFICRISPSLTRRDLEDYFATFGAVTDLKLLEKEAYGFVEFSEPFDDQILLANREHFIGAHSLIVERSRSAPRDRGDRAAGYQGGQQAGYNSYNPHDSYSSYDPRRNDHDSYNSYRAEPYRAEPYRTELPRAPGPCNHCDRCPRHGFLGGVLPNAHLKIVCDGIDFDVTRDDLSAYAVGHGFDPSFVKARGPVGLLEFRTLAEKDNAFKKLDGTELVRRDSEGNEARRYTITTRSYVSNAELYDGSSRPAEPQKRRRMESGGYDDGHDMGCGDRDGSEVAADHREVRS